MAPKDSEAQTSRFQQLEDSDSGSVSDDNNDVFEEACEGRSAVVGDGDGGGDNDTTPVEGSSASGSNGLKGAETNSTKRREENRCNDAELEERLLPTALEYKNLGNSQFTSGQFQPALDSYRDGLRELPELVTNPSAPSRRRAPKGKNDNDSESEEEEDESEPKDVWDEDEEIFTPGYDESRSKSKSKDKGKGKAKAEDDDYQESKEEEEEERISETMKKVKELRATLQSNIAACLLKMDRLEEAITACTAALNDVPDYVKALQRRAMANEKMGNWRALGDAKADLEHLLSLPSPPNGSLPSSLRPSLQSSLKRIEPLLKQAQQRETDEMLGKLKDLGNGLLGKFGMSLDQFKMEKGEGGGYSLRMNG